MIMDLTQNYTDEEKAVFERADQLRQQIRDLENNAYALRYEVKEHKAVSHTDLVPAIVFTVLCLINVILFILDILLGVGTFSYSSGRESNFDSNSVTLMALAIAFVVGTPTLAIYFGIMAFIHYRRLFYQTATGSDVQGKAHEKGFTNYAYQKRRMDIEYDLTEKRLMNLRKLYEEAQMEADAITERKERERRSRSEQAKDLSFEIVKHEKGGY